LGLVNTVASVGGYLGAIIVGVLSRRTGDFGMAFAILGLGLLAGAALALNLKQEIPRPYRIPQQQFRKRQTARCNRSQL